jgi:hypothetical protein
VLCGERLGGLAGSLACLLARTKESPRLFGRGLPCLSLVVSYYFSSNCVWVVVFKPFDNCMVE